MTLLDTRPPADVVIDLTGAAPSAEPTPKPVPPSVRVVRRPPVRTRVLRLLTGLLLLVAAVAAVVAAVVTVTYRVSLTPVLSPSMEPAFAAGDLLVTRALDSRDVQVGQVLVLPLPDAPGQRFVHRVESVRFVDGQPVVTTKGDNNPAADPWRLRISSHEVPVVVTHVDNVGQLGLATRSQGLRLVLLGLVAFLALVGIKRALL